jgi:RNA polymerase sigma-70 factor (ECF subfamily)
VVILVYSEGLTHAQTADILGLAETTVSWHLHEARKSLKSYLTEEASNG